MREFADALNRAERLTRDSEEVDRGFDPDDGLSIREAEAVALVLNRDLRIARLESNVTRATAAHIGLWQDPIFGFDFERIVSGASGMNDRVLGSSISLTLPLSGRLGAEKARVGAELEGKLKLIVAKEWAVRSTLRELWVQWSVAKMRTKFKRELLEGLREIARLAGQQEDAGTLSRANSQTIFIELAEREVELIAESAREREFESQLRSILGVGPQASVSFVPTIVFSPRTTDAEKIRRLLEQSNPELAAVRALYDASEQALRVEVRKQYPDITIGPGYGADQGDDRITFGVSFPIPIWNRNQLGVSEAAAKREVAGGMFQATYEHLGMQLEIALLRFESGRNQRLKMESEVIPLVETYESDVAESTKLGHVDPFLIRQSLVIAHDAKIRLIEARAAESLGAIRIEELIGPQAGIKEDAPASPAVTTQPVPSDMKP